MPRRDLRRISRPDRQADRGFLRPRPVRPAPAARALAPPPGLGSSIEARTLRRRRRRASRRRRPWAAGPAGAGCRPARRGAGPMRRPRRARSPGSSLSGMTTTRISRRPSRSRPATCRRPRRGRRAEAESSSRSTSFSPSTTNTGAPSAPRGVGQAVEHLRMPLIRQVPSGARCRRSFGSRRGPRRRRGRRPRRGSGRCRRCAPANGRLARSRRPEPRSPALRAIDGRRRCAAEAGRGTRRARRRRPRLVVEPGPCSRSIESEPWLA